MFSIIIYSKPAFKTSVKYEWTHFFLKNIRLLTNFPSSTYLSKEVPFTIAVIYSKNYEFMEWLTNVGNNLIEEVPLKSVCT